MQRTIEPAAADEPRPAPAGSSTVVTAARNHAVDVYRGFVMFLMMAEVTHLARVAKAFPESWFWAALAYNQSHVPWAGCSLHDLIQPSFSFLVGVALPYSVASRLAKGSPFGNMFTHAVWRAFLLAALGVFLRSTNSPQTNFTFEDTLSQIGFGYPFLFLIAFLPVRKMWAAAGAILTLYWLAWALYPAPAPPVEPWPHDFTGFASHWNKNTNLGSAFDAWFLNLFPRAKPFVANGGGYLTLSFIPTLGTMILGLIAGSWLRETAPRIPMRRFLITGAALIAGGLVLHFTGICPIVKRIWTPAWTLFSGGACFLLLAGFSWLVEIKGYRKWAFPLEVIGLNSIAAYMIAHLFERFFVDSFRIHLGADVFAFLGAGLQPLMQGLAVLAMYWLVLYWMFRRKLFLRI